MQAKERTIFLDAIEIGDQQKRIAYIDSVCGDDELLKESVFQLLRAHDRSNIAVDRSPYQQVAKEKSVGTETTMMHLDSNAPLEESFLCDGYRLMEQIGEGGFGIVYVAQQDKPVRRQVALKIIKPGMGSKDVLARFEAERQALAMMDHPGIAKVFDAGVSKDGRPFFVMELVRGVPITDFCDKAQLSVRQRLELFESVCSAVHHAHQKGIIHRDLKPSNLLATMYDDKPVVKVIDFGIAKAIGQSLTDKTVYTRFMSMMGTPLYMSPEQAEMNSLDVDTRSDIYSLGVLLYELLTGTTPIEKARLDSVGLHELRRIILEEEPPRPSYRLSTIANQRRTTVANPKTTEPARMTSAIRGDLDWIVMKAIEKDRKRRYDSAAALARDVRCFLNSEPIEARPPSQIYRLTKFAQRNRLAIVTASFIACSLIVTTGVSWYQKSQAVAALKEKEDALTEAQAAKAQATAAQKEVELFSQRIVEANLLLTTAQSNIEDEDWAIARENYSKAVQLQPSYYLPWVARGQMYLRLNLWEEASLDFGQAIKLGAPTNQPSWHGVGGLLALYQNTDAMNELFRQESNRLRAEDGTINWLAVRNCLFTCVDDESIDWASIAAQLVAASPPDDFRREGGRGRQRGGPEVRDGFGGPDGRGGFGGPDGPAGPEGFGPPRGDHMPPEREHDRNGGPGGMRGGGFPAGARAYLIGLAFLKANDPNKAFEYLTKSLNDLNWNAREIAYAPLAIACNRQNKLGDAQSFLQKSEQYLNRSLENMSATVMQPQRGQPWFDLVEALVVHRQAAQSILKQEDAVVGKLESIHQKALRQLEGSL